MIALSRCRRTIRHTSRRTLDKEPAPSIYPPTRRDEYPDVLFISREGRFRVIRDNVHPQWLVQSRHPLAVTGDHPWRTEAYCTTPEGVWLAMEANRPVPPYGFLKFFRRLPPTSTS
ncbi:hypothetical protein EBL89_15760 [Cereibacter sphaeroides]|uniref:hypothetical protein n=1 Tax=Cereibacter sphaeroides TaxID=1063 RepID=UPI000F54455D|nr:hypothetical protein [Cereibacter sphaeroides]AZB56681.1 hypothetical protein EBL89_15760 [Cereibacter sphaeroides]AZB60955.1 hypothetical protein EBL88_15730 [Cereibacter sphaeroides]